MSLETKTIWKPQPGPQTEFLSRPEFEGGYGGAKGGGKTDAILFGGLRQIQNENYRAIIFRRTFPQLKEIIARSKKKFRTLGGMWNGQDKRWTFPSGSIFEFGMCQYEDDKENYQGQEYHYMGFDQLEQFTESMYTYLIANIRSTDPTIRLMVRSSFNPGSVGHLFVKSRFIENKTPFQTYINTYELENPLTNELIKVDFSSIFVPAKVWDNKILLETNPNYLANLMQLDEKTRKALLDGDFDVFEGQYFHEWRRDLHIVEPEKHSIHGYYKKFICGDYGYAKPSAIYWCATDEDGTVFVYRELYKTGLTFEQLTKEIISMTPPAELEQIKYWVMDPAIWAKTAERKGERAKLSGAEIMEQTYKEVVHKGLYLTRGNNDRINGWNVVREYLKPKLDRNGHTIAGIQIFSTCVNLIRTLPALVYDQTSVEDVDTEGEDHGPDGIRYGLMTSPPKSHGANYNLTTNLLGNKGGRQAANTGGDSE